MPLLAPIAHFSGFGWLTTIITLAVVLPLSRLPKSWTGLPKSIALSEILWLGVLTAALLPDSARYWPSDNETVVPLTILALSVLTTPDAAPRITKVLSACVAVLAFPILVAAASKLNRFWLRPTWTTWPWGLTLGLLLANLPAAPRKGRLIFVAIGISVMIQGVLSVTVSTGLPDALYQTSRTLGRLEPVVAAAMTLLWYTMSVTILQSAVHIAKENGIETKVAYVLHTGTVAIMILCKWQLQQHKTALLSVFFLVLIPFLRKMKKVKNSA